PDAAGVTRPPRRPALTYGGRLRHRRSADAEQVMLASDEEHSVGDGRRGHTDIADGVGRQQGIVGPCLNDQDAAFFAREIELAVRGYRRSRETATAAEGPLVHLLAGLCLVARHPPAVRAGIQV